MKPLCYVYILFIPFVSLSLLPYYLSSLLSITSLYFAFISFMFALSHPLSFRRLSLSPLSPFHFNSPLVLPSLSLHPSAIHPLTSFSLSLLAPSHHNLRPLSLMRPSSFLIMLQLFLHLNLLTALYLPFSSLILLLPLLH